MFLPHVDNWAVCDSIHVINDKPRKQKLKEKALEWINAEHDFTIRFGVLVLMKRFLDEDFSVELMQKICRIKSEGYYVKMMKAWYIASALDKQYEYAYEALNSGWLDDWVHNKAIQKASESRLVNTPTKNILKAMKK